MIQNNEQIIFYSGKHKITVYDVLKKEMKHHKFKDKEKHVLQKSMRNILHFREQGKINQDIDHLLQFSYVCNEKSESEVSGANN